MINKQTILSVADDELTLYEWLTYVQDALENASLETATINDEGDGKVSFSFVFGDGSKVDTGTLTIPTPKDGKDGVGVSSIAVSDAGELVVSLTDGSSVNAGSTLGKAGTITKNGDTYEITFTKVNLPNSDALLFTDSNKTIGDAMAEIADDVDAKQDKLSDDQLAACNSGINKQWVTNANLAFQTQSETISPGLVQAQDDISDLQDDVSSVKTSVASKQDKLVSGTNIKSVNGNSLLGSGNITISGETTYMGTYPINIANKVIKLLYNGDAFEVDTSGTLSINTHYLSDYCFVLEVDNYYIVLGSYSIIQITDLKNLTISRVGEITGQTYGTFEAAAAAMSTLWGDLSTTYRTALIQFFLGILATHGGNIRIFEKTNDYIWNNNNYLTIVTDYSNVKLYYVYNNTLTDIVPSIVQSGTLAIYTSEYRNKL